SASLRGSLSLTSLREGALADGLRGTQIGGRKPGLSCMDRATARCSTVQPRRARLDVERPVRPTGRHGEVQMVCADGRGDWSGRMVEGPRHSGRPGRGPLPTETLTAYAPDGPSAIRPPLEGAELGPGPGLDT